MQETTSASVNSKRIAKNTMMLYIRMFLIMAVNLYTSRVILEALGEEGFGIYSVVGGLVVLFTFVNNAMVASTQRFLNFELGKGDIVEAQKVFSASLSIHFLIAIIFLFLAESVGLWFLNHYIVIPEYKISAANFVYQFTIISAIINIIRTPYNAVIIANEKMSFYAYISIIEVILKLVIVYCVYLFADALIAYAALLSIVSIIICIGYYIYCRLNFPISIYKFEYNRERYTSIAKFSGWSLFGSVANICGQQGTNIILNMFFGVGVNAAMGIANQVNTAIYTFVSNFQTAFNPQIVKSYAANNRDYFVNLILKSSRYSFMLIFILELPILICTPHILQVWLHEVPEYAIEFCRLMLIFSLIDAVQGPLWVSAQAVGNIRNYQLLIGGLILCNIPLIYFSLLFFPDPVIALVVRVVINIITAIARIIYLKSLYDFPIASYFSDVVLRCLGVISIAFPIPYIYYNNDGNWFFSILLALLCVLVTIIIVGITRSERLIIYKKVKSYLY